MVARKGSSSRQVVPSLIDVTSIDRLFLQYDSVSQASAPLSTSVVRTNDPGFVRNVAFSDLPPVRPPRFFRNYCTSCFFYRSQCSRFGCRA